MLTSVQLNISRFLETSHKNQPKRNNSDTLDRIEAFLIQIQPFKEKGHRQFLVVVLLR